MTGQHRYCVVLVGWLACSMLPAFAGDWWDQHFHVYQALCSLVIVWIASKVADTWWSHYLQAACLLPIIHASGDFFADISPTVYNDIQSLFTALEALILVSGGVSELINGRDNADGNHGVKRDRGGGINGGSHA